MSRFAVVCTTVLVLVLAAPLTALAAAPPAGPTQIVSDGFEDGQPRAYSVYPLVSLPNYDGNRYWGRVGARYRSGAKGLWCNGSAGVPTPFTYTPRSAGVARFDLPQTADYYSASVSFWYLMPSLGAYDQNSFVTQWGTDPMTEYIKNDYALASTWRQVVYDLTPAKGYDSLSRKAGYIAFEFKDEIFGNRVGEGPTIDDVSVTGYHYGPVRSLAAEESGGDAVVSWLRPYRSPGVTTLEERDIVYKVWRSPATANPAQWTEVASAVTDNGSSARFTDTSVVPGSSYRYRVHAWAASGSWYGEPAETTVIMPSADASVSFDSTVTGSTTVTARSNCPAAAGGYLRWRVGTTWSGWLPYATETQIKLPAGDGLKIAEFEYSTSADGNPVVARASASITLDETGPRPTIQSPADGFPVRAGDAVTFTGTAQDGAGISTVRLRFRRSDGMYWNGTAWQSGETWLTASTSDGHAHFSYTWTPPADTDWARTAIAVTAQAVDGVGNAGPGTSVRSARLTELTPSSARSYTILYGRSQSFSGRLRTVEGYENVAGQTVVLQRLVKSAWTDVAQSVTSATGVVTFTVKPSSKSVYRMAFRGASGYLADTSADITVTPSVLLGAPSAPSSIARGVRFTSSGILRPRHPAGTELQVRAYRYEQGRWVHRYTFVAKASDYDWYSKYAASVRITLPGTWRLRAYAPADSGHVATWSPYSANFVVR